MLAQPCHRDVPSGTHDAMWPESLSSQVWGKPPLPGPPSGIASETCKFPNMTPNYPCCLFFFLLNIVLWSEADGIKPGRYANSSLQKSAYSPSVGSLWQKGKKKMGGGSLLPTVDWLIRDHHTYSNWSWIGHLAKCDAGIYSTVTQSPLSRAFLQP